MLKKMMITYKFYDNRGRRLAIFGYPMRGYIQAYIITCSNKDKFCKRNARTAIENYLSEKKPHFLEWDKPVLVHPIVVSIPIHDNKPQQSFIEWCHKNYYYKTWSTVVSVKEVLVKDEKPVPGVEYLIYEEEIDRYGCVDNVNKFNLDETAA